MRGPASPWHTTALHPCSKGSNSEKSVSFSEPPRMRTMGASKLSRAATTAARVGRLGVVHVGDARDPRNDLHAVRLGFVSEQASLMSSNVAPSLSAAAAAKSAFSWLCTPAKRNPANLQDPRRVATTGHPGQRCRRGRRLATRNRGRPRHRVPRDLGAHRARSSGCWPSKIRSLSAAYSSKGRASSDDPASR